MRIYCNYSYRMTSEVMRATLRSQSIPGRDSDYEWIYDEIYWYPKLKKKYQQKLRLMKKNGQQKADGSTKNTGIDHRLLIKVANKLIKAAGKDEKSINKYNEYIQKENCRSY